MASSLTDPPTVIVTTTETNVIAEPNGPSQAIGINTNVLQVVDDDMKRFLEQESAWAADLVKKLTSPDKRDNRMPEAMVNACEALAFLDVHEGGLGLTIARGHGFLIRKLAQDHHGNSRWSCPAFFTVAQAGAGFSAGYQRVQSCVGILNRQTVNLFLTQRLTMGTDVAIFSTDAAMTGLPSATLGWGQQMAITADSQTACFTYSLADGLYFDISLHGTRVAPDSATMARLYGGGVAPEDVVQRPATRELQALQLAVNKCGTRAAQGAR